jgi:hypothetical protein
MSEEHKQMTPKRLGILIVALVALWSLVGPAEAPHPRLVPAISGVDVAHAGDPDQYTNKPEGSPAFSPGDTSATPPSPLSEGHVSFTPSSMISAVVQVASILLWGKGTIY